MLIVGASFWADQHVFRHEDEFWGLTYIPGSERLEVDTGIQRGSNRLHCESIQSPGFGQSSASIHVNSAKKLFFFFFPFRLGTQGAWTSKFLNLEANVLDRRKNI
jgi:hypothetical protein